MSEHNFECFDETPEVIKCRCTVCGVEVDFVKPGCGEPAAELVDGQWRCPDVAKDYVGPCSG